MARRRRDRAWGTGAHRPHWSVGVPVRRPDRPPTAAGRAPEERHASTSTIDASGGDHGRGRRDGDRGVRPHAPAPRCQVPAGGRRPGLPGDAGRPATAAAVRPGTAAPGRTAGAHTRRRSTSSSSSPRCTSRASSPTRSSPPRRRGCSAERGLIAGRRADVCDARGVRTWNVGDITVTSVIEVDGPAPGPFLFSEATPDVVAVAPRLGPRHVRRRRRDAARRASRRSSSRRRAGPSSSTRASATTSSATSRRGTTCSCRSSTASVRPGSTR